jgi:ABC-type nitrate/sulfonate/bicarbonate transport system permease component
MDRAAAEARVARAGGPLPLPAFSPNQIRLVTVAACVALWEGLARTGWFYRGVIPTTASVAVALVGEVARPEFYRHCGITLAEVSAGFVAGGLAGVALGILFGARHFLWRAAAPYVNAIGSTPKIVFLPILFLLFGVGIESKMAKGALSTFFPVVVSTTAGMLAINPVWLRVGASFRLTRWQTITKIYMPAMVRPVVTGMRLGLGVGIIGVLVAEIKYANGGLGYLAIQYYTQFDIPRMYAMLLIIFALAVLANVGMTRLTGRFYWDGGNAPAEPTR